MVAYCEVDDCDRQVHSGGRHCAGHAKRLERGGSLSTPLREALSLRERVQKLVNDLADADSEDDKAYERAWDALEHALRKWGDSMRARRAALAQAAAMTPKQRRQRAKNAAAARWWNRMLASKHLVARSARRNDKGKRRRSTRP